VKVVILVFFSGSEIVAAGEARQSKKEVERDQGLI
jgi:hypothetical protein